MSKLSSFKDSLVARGNNNNPSNTVFRNMAVLAGGSGVARVIGSLSIPIITRIYTPEDMGVFSVFVALSAMLVPFVTLRYSVALPLPKKDRLATNLAALCLFLLCIMSAFLALALLLFAQPILTMLSMQILLPYWWLLIITVIGTGLYEVLSQWALREKAFTVVAKTQVGQSVSGSAVKIGLGLLGLKPLGLLIGQIVAQAGGALSLLAHFQRKFRVNRRYLSKSHMYFLFKYYSDFPKYRLPSQSLLVFSSQAPLLFSAKLFGAETTGQLGLAMMVLALPISLLGQTTGQAYYAEIAKIGRKNPDLIRVITKNVTKKLFLMGILPALILLSIGPWLFTIIFGGDWNEAGTFSRILAIYLMAQFVSAPLINVLNVFNRQSLLLVFNIVRFFILIVIYLLSYYFSLDAVTFVTLYSFFLTIHYLLISSTIIKVIK